MPVPFWTCATGVLAELRIWFSLRSHVVAPTVRIGVPSAAFKDNVLGNACTADVSSVGPRPTVTVLLTEVMATPWAPSSDLIVVRSFTSDTPKPDACRAISAVVESAREPAERVTLIPVPPWSDLIYMFWLLLLGSISGRPDPSVVN